MSIVLIEEVLMGLDDVKSTLGQAAVTLENIIEDMHPDLMPGLQEDLERDFLHPLHAHVSALETLLDQISTHMSYVPKSLHDDLDALDDLEVLDDLDDM
jgi:hypothetical protein